MDDLSGLDWNAASRSNNKPPTPAYNYSGFSATTASPAFSTTPVPQNLSRPSSTLNGSKPPAKLPSPANDSFSNLLSLNSNKGPNNLTLQERQRQLLEEKRKQEVEQRKRLDSQFASDDTRFWDNLGSGKGTPEPRAGTHAGNGKIVSSQSPETEDDILAAFNSAAPVDKSSHFPPPPSASASGRGTPATAQSNGLGSVQNGGNDGIIDDDDDPFGLGAMPERRTARSGHPTQQTDDDDILGDLGKPVTAKAPSRAPVDEALDVSDRSVSPQRTTGADPRDHAIAELVDMGFPADRSRLALQDTNGNVQAAVGWLLNQAHEESRQKARGGQSTDGRGTPAGNGGSQARTSSQRRGQEPLESAVPAWMRQDGRSSSSQRRQDSNSPAPEKDVAHLASEFGSTFLKSANSLWKTGQKRLQKTMAEFQQEGGDPSQPKWMREASADSQRSTSRRPEAAERALPPRHAQQPADITDEAVLLEMGDARPQKPTRPTATSRFAAEGPPSRGRSPAHDLPDRTAPQPRFMQQHPVQDKRPATKLSRQEVEAQSAQAYVSPARRKKATPQPAPPPEPEIDLFSPAPSAPSSRPPPPKPSQQPTTSSRPTPSPQPPRPKPAPRATPPLNPLALQQSTQHRLAGTEAFKRGDYAHAHASYTSALTALPPSHPIRIILLSNRALTALKTGDPKAAIADADAAIALIGPGKGEGEVIELGAQGGGVKEIKEFYGKALMRKAEALEGTEKWTEAASVWRACVEAGVGGAVSARGRDRCEKAAGAAGTAAKAPSAPASRPASTRPARATTGKAKPAGHLVKPRPSRPAVTAAASAAAVQKLREANAAAEKADDEKFLLSDAVEAKMAAWKGGKSDNLRALLGSLDSVLWPEAGWRKVGMGDLVVPGRCKVVYMRAIGKVHPDKVGF